MTSRSRLQTRRGWRADGWAPTEHNARMAARKREEAIYRRYLQALALQRRQWRHLTTAAQGTTVKLQKLLKAMNRVTSDV